eukprot:51420_1
MKISIPIIVLISLCSEFASLSGAAAHSRKRLDSPKNVSGYFDDTLKRMSPITPRSSRSRTPISSKPRSTRTSPRSRRQGSPQSDNLYQRYSPNLYPLGGQQTPRSNFRPISPSKGRHTVGRTYARLYSPPTTNLYELRSPRNSPQSPVHSDLFQSSARDMVTRQKLGDGLLENAHDTTPMHMHMPVPQRQKMDEPKDNKVTANKKKWSWSDSQGDGKIFFQYKQMDGCMAGWGGG